MKIRYGLVLALALGFAFTGCASGGGGTSGDAAAPPSVVPGAEQLAQGERPRQTENTRAAQRALDEADGVEEEAQRRTLLGQALQSADAAVAEDPTNPLAHRQKALAHLGLEDYHAAAAAFDEAARLRPIYEFEDAGIRERAWINLYQEAIPFVNQGEYEQAVELFEAANAIYSQRPEAFFTVGQIYAQLREHDKALEAIDNAMAIVESDAVAEMDSATVAAWEEQAATVPTMRAQILADAGRFEEAAAVFRNIVAADPSDVLAQRNLAGILVQTGQLDEAFVVYDQLLQRTDLSAGDYYTIGVGYYQGDAYERAADAFSKSVERNPRDRDGLEMWARSLQIDSAWTAIPPVTQRWVDLDPYNQNAYLIYAQAANQNGDEDQARTMVQRIEALEVQVDNLQITRFAEGGARVSGVVTNKTLEAGATVTLEFTFYSPSGSPMGTVTRAVQVGQAGMNEVFQLEFSSADRVGGYGYELTVG